MIRSKLLGAFLLAAMAMLPLAGCRTTVVERNQPVVQPAPQADRHDDRRPPPPPDHHDDQPDARH
jgi:hypothetical protein